MDIQGTKTAHSPGKTFCRLGMAALLLGVSNLAYASAFQLFEENVAGIQNFGAGGAAIANDASTNFFNSAGLTRLKDAQVIVSGIQIITDLKFRGDASLVNPVFPPAAPFTESGNAQGGSSNLVPAFYIASPVTDRIAVGFGVTAPFGLETNWGDTAITRYAATKTKVITANLNPTIAYQATDRFSFGVGFDAQYMEADFDSAATLVPGSPTVGDSASISYGTDWGYGWDAGVLFEYSPHTRAGLSFRSQVSHTLKGRSKLVGPLASTANSIVGITSDQIVSNNLSARVMLPPTTMASVYHDFNEKWSGMGTVVYTHWNTVKNLVLNNVASVQSAGPAIIPKTDLIVSAPQRFRNTWRVAVGADYHMNERLLFRGGLGYDRTPTRDEFRSLRLPDGNRFAISVGSHFQASKRLGLDAGYTHLFVEDGDINNFTAITGRQEATLLGKSKNRADLIGVQVTWDLDIV